MNYSDYYKPPSGGQSNWRDPNGKLPPKVGLPYLIPGAQTGRPQMGYQPYTPPQQLPYQRPRSNVTYPYLPGQDWLPGWKPTFYQQQQQQVRPGGFRMADGQIGYRRSSGIGQQGRPNQGQPLPYSSYQPGYGFQPGYGGQPNYGGRPDYRPPGYDSPRMNY